MNAIISGGNDYCIEVKGNQKRLKTALVAAVASGLALSSHSTRERNRGRLENRLVELYEKPPGIDSDWLGIQRIAHVRRFGWRPDGGDYDESHYFILGPATDDARKVAEGIRGHWHIENRLHYVKDVIQNEDGSGISGGFAAENLFLLKNIAINLFGLNGIPSIKSGNIAFANKINKMWKLMKCENVRTD